MVGSLQFKFEVIKLHVDLHFTDTYSCINNSLYHVYYALYF